jgi:hypothetical protein
MSTPHRLCLALVFCLPSFVCSQQSNAQAAAAAQSKTVSAPRSDAAEGLIKLDVVVTDKSGKPVTALEPKDFTLWENDQPDKILSFHAFDGISAKPDPPVEVILLIDTVNLPAKQASKRGGRNREVPEAERRASGPAGIDFLAFLYRLMESVPAAAFQRREYLSCLPRPKK